MSQVLPSTIEEIVEIQGPTEIEINLDNHFCPPTMDSSLEAEDLERLVNRYVINVEEDQPNASLIGVAHRVIQGLRDGNQLQSVTPIIGGYGTGKSYLALMLSVLLTRPVGDPLVKLLLTNMQRQAAQSEQAQKMVTDVEDWIEQRKLPYLVVPLVFNREAAVSLFQHVVGGVDRAIRKWGNVPRIEESGIRLMQYEAQAQIKKWTKSAPSVLLSIDSVLRKRWDMTIDDLTRELDDPRKVDPSIRKLLEAYSETYATSLQLHGVGSIQSFLTTVIDAYAIQREGTPAAFQGMVLMLDEFHHYLEVQASRLTAEDPGSRLDLQEFANAVRTRNQYISLLLLSPTSLVAAINRVIANTPGAKADDLNRFRERLGVEVKLTYRDVFFSVTASYLKHQPSIDAFLDSHQTELNTLATWLSDRFQEECESLGLHSKNEIELKLIRRYFPLHPLAVILLCRYLVGNLEQHRTLGKLFLPEDGDLDRWCTSAPPTVNGHLNWYTPLQIVRFYKDSLVDSQFRASLDESLYALATAIPGADKTIADVLSSVCFTSELVPRWRCTIDVVASLCGHSEDLVIQSLDRLESEGLVRQIDQGHYKLDVQTRNVRVRYKTDLEKALAQKPLRDEHPAKVLAKTSSPSDWLKNVKAGAFLERSNKLGQDREVVPLTFLAEKRIEAPENNPWAWSIEYVSVTDLNDETIAKRIPVDDPRSGCIVRVVPTSEQDLALAKGTINNWCNGPNAPEWLRRVAFACPDEPMDVERLLSILYVHRKIWGTDKRAQEYASIIGSDSKDDGEQFRTIETLNNTLANTYTPANCTWFALPEFALAKQDDESEVVSKIQARRFLYAPPTQQVLAKRPVDELLYYLFQDDLTELIKAKNPTNKPRLIIEHVIKSPWALCDPKTNRLIAPTNNSPVYRHWTQLESCWKQVEKGQEILLWEDLDRLCDEPYGLGRKETFKLLLAANIGLKLAKGGRICAFQGTPTSPEPLDDKSFFERLSPNHQVDTESQNPRDLGEDLTQRRFNSLGLLFTAIVSTSPAPPAGEATLTSGDEVDVNVGEEPSPPPLTQPKKPSQEPSPPGPVAGKGKAIVRGAVSISPLASSLSGLGENPVERILAAFRSLTVAEQQRTIEQMIRTLPKAAQKQLRAKLR